MILLDTCTFLWLVNGGAALSAAARTQISSNAGTLFLSAISAFEIDQKAAKGRLELPLPPLDWYRRALVVHGIREVAVTGDIGLRASALAPLHADPFDRILVATAQAYNYLLLTPDPLIAAYPGLRTAW